MLEKTSFVICFIFLLGSYDHKMKLFDARMDKSVLTMDHGQPVERLLLYPSEALLVSAGRNVSTAEFTLLHFSKYHTSLGTLHKLLALQASKDSCCYFKVGVT